MTDSLKERLREYNEAYIETAMEHWDGWRAYIAKGGKGSLPRDGFESHLYGWCDDAKEALARIEELEQEANNYKFALFSNQGVHNQHTANAEATIAKLEGENKELIEDNKILMGNTNAAIEDYNDSLATIATLQGKLDRALDTINKVFGIAYPHPSRTFDTMIKDMGLIDDLCRSILSDLSPDGGKE